MVAPIKKLYNLFLSSDAYNSIWIQTSSKCFLNNKKHFCFLNSNSTQNDQSSSIRQTITKSTAASQAHKKRHITILSYRYIEKKITPDLHEMKTELNKSTKIPKIRTISKHPSQTKSQKRRDLAERNLRKKEKKKGRNWNLRDLAEFSLEGWVNLLEGSAKGWELLASFIGDQKLGHAIPIDILWCLEGNIGDFLDRAAHFLNCCLSDFSKGKKKKKRMNEKGNWFPFVESSKHRYRRLLFYCLLPQNDSFRISASFSPSWAQAHHHLVHGLFMKIQSKFLYIVHFQHQPSICPSG